jgi:hypothetical protein
VMVMPKLNPPGVRPTLAKDGVGGQEIMGGTRGDRP